MISAASSSWSSVLSPVSPIPKDSSRDYPREYRGFVEHESKEDLTDEAHSFVLEVAKNHNLLSVANAQERIRLHTVSLAAYSDATEDHPALGP